jgi:multisubunit Na+/H+ antiporter MnhG subunit
MSSSLDRNAQSVWLILCMAIGTAMLRLSIMLANTLVLWHVYGRTRVVREHLQITKSKPELVVSNGDILRGLTFQHYLIGAAIWVVISFLAILILYRFLVPTELRRILKQTKANTPGSLGTLWALGLFVFVAALLPLAAALTLALFSVACAVWWAWRDALAAGRREAKRERFRYK